jgi:hypothetical protein
VYKYIAWLFLFNSPFIIRGQFISGHITDIKHNPITNAYIFAPSGTIHAHSDVNGFYELKKIRIGDTINISFLGFKNIQHILSKDDFAGDVDFHLKEVPFELQQVYVTSDVNAISQIASIDLELNPVSSSQEVLTRVPGLFISQHAGGGKAEQIFLRGFDIDHGTDIAITVDGLPVNMVSHAHGQGYADLHFLIPETIENIDFGKGPYYADHGNLNTAGYIDFKTKDKLENSILGIEVGDFSTIRTFGLVNLIEGEVDQNAYIATEFLSSDGPFESPQDFVRMNLMGKYVKETEKGDRFSLLVTRFSSRWNAYGQIPQRLVDSGTITRYGSVDDTEGGTTSRTNFALDHSKILS